MTDDDDTDAGGDFFVDLVKTVVALLAFVLFLLVMGGAVVGILSWFS
jgi:hypothetical protein